MRTGRAWPDAVIAKGLQGLPAATASQETGQGQSLPQRIHEEAALPTPSLQTSSLQNCKRVRLCCFKPPSFPVYGHFLQWPQEANTALTRVGGRANHVRIWEEKFPGRRSPSWGRAQPVESSRMRSEVTDKGGWQAADDQCLPGHSEGLNRWSG